jgi:anti-sigma B factor antagonist
MALSIGRSHSGDTLVFSPAGEVDLSSAPDLRKALLAAGKESCATVAVNLAEVEYMDSSGVAVLIEGLKAAQESGKAFALITPSTPVMKVLTLARLDSVFTIHTEG